MRRVYFECYFCEFEREGEFSRGKDLYISCVVDAMLTEVVVHRNEVGNHHKNSNDLKVSIDRTNLYGHVPKSLVRQQQSHIARS